MAGFRKAKGEQAYLKVAIYGGPGDGKTFTALLLAEGLAKASGKRVAVVDTEHGTDFYARAVERQTHPEAFDFDALYTRSITEVITEVKGLDLNTHGVLVIDSISHLWDAAQQAYRGPKNKAGQIPMWAWNNIKKPYKDLMALLLNLQAHVFILGRQASQFEEDAETGEMKAAGLKMRAEKETAHEPHLCIRMEAVRTSKPKQPLVQVPTAFVEKDRSGLLTGQAIAWPSFKTICQPLLPLLGQSQAQVQTEDEAGAQDAEAIGKAEREKERLSATTRDRMKARLQLAESVAAVEAIGKEITPGLKKQMLPQDLESLRASYLDALDRAKGIARPTTSNTPSEETSDE